VDVWTTICVFVCVRVCVAVCCSVLQCVAVCCSVLQRVDDDMCVRVCSCVCVRERVCKNSNARTRQRLFPGRFSIYIGLFIQKKRRVKRDPRRFVGAVFWISFHICRSLYTIKRRVKRDQ